MVSSDLLHHCISSLQNFKPAPLDSQGLYSLQLSSSNRCVRTNLQSYQYWKTRNVTIILPWTNHRRACSAWQAGNLACPDGDFDWSAFEAKAWGLIWFLLDAHCFRYDGINLAKLPFEPPSLVRKLSQRNLADAKINDCAFVSCSICLWPCDNILTNYDACELCVLDIMISVYISQHCHCSRAKQKFACA